jgi:hypothetical protein
MTDILCCTSINYSDFFTVVQVVKRTSKTKYTNA